MTYPLRRYRHTVAAHRSDGRTALHLAAADGQVDAVSYLLAPEATVGPFDVVREPPLYILSAPRVALGR